MTTRVLGWIDSHPLFSRLYVPVVVTATLVVLVVTGGR